MLALGLVTKALILKSCAVKQRSEPQCTPRRRITTTTEISIGTATIRLVTPYVSAWAKFRQETGFAPRLIQTPRHRGNVRRALRLYIGYREGLFNGRPTVVELKCTAGRIDYFLASPRSQLMRTSPFSVVHWIWLQCVACAHLKPNGNYSLSRFLTFATIRFLEPHYFAPRDGAINHHRVAQFQRED